LADVMHIGVNALCGRNIGMNRPGANTNIATEAVVRAPPEGYTLLLVDSAAALNAMLYDKLTFNFCPRHRAGRGHCAPTRGHDDQSVR
jgi:hypothetical protein